MGLLLVTFRITHTNTNKGEAMPEVNRKDFVHSLDLLSKVKNGNLGKEPCRRVSCIDGPESRGSEPFLSTGMR